MEREKTGHDVRGYGFVADRRPVRRQPRRQSTIHTALFGAEERNVICGLRVCFFVE
jgi:hypothetical protein